MAEPISSVLLGTLSATVGFVVARWYQVADVRRRTYARLQALRAEIAECGSRANHLRQAQADWIIGYVLPDWVGHEALGALAADGLFNEAEARVLIQFYALVADANMNLGYSRAAGPTDVGGPRGVQLAAKKAAHLFDEENGVTLVLRAEAVVTKAIDEVAKWRWWHPFLARRWV